MKHNFKNLNIWKLSRELVKEVYLITKEFPADERFGLTSQIRRCVVSIPSNIAEGCGRGTDKQLAYFLDVSVGSCCELESHLYLCFDLDYINEIDLENLTSKVTSIRRMTLSFQAKYK
ncbi:MAG: four helix bundle protein [Chitinophagales bacterium]